MTPGGGQRRRLAATVDARARSLRASRRYRAVLALIIVSFLFTSIAPDESWTRGVLLLIESATLGTAMWRSGGDTLRRSLLVIALASILAVVQIVAGGLTLTTTVAAISGVFAIATVVVIARGVVRQGVINQQSIVGALGIYLLFGMVFTFVYGVMAAQSDGAFFAQGTDGTPAIRLYFSFTTLCTVGYGDYTAAGDLGHTLAVSEALLGQLYLVTVVALLVSRVRPARGDASPS